MKYSKLILLHLSLPFHRILKDNSFNGTLSFGDSFSEQLQLVNFENNKLTSVTITAAYNETLM